MTQTAPEVWKLLEGHARRLADHTLSGLFKDEPQRASRLTTEVAGLRVDYSRHLLDSEAWAALSAWGDAAGLMGAADKMRGGALINPTEGRPALHSALRHRGCADANSVAEDIDAANAQLAAIAEKLRSGQWRGATGEVITDFVNIGIGGSDLGPRAAVQALSRPDQQPVSVHFLANIDGVAIDDLLAQLNPATTVFCVTSKSFGTRETLTNASSARSWLLGALGPEASMAAHLVAVSANVQRAVDFGVAEENILPMWDWVGGRYSLWSTVGLPIAVALGADTFAELLAGAAAMDEHFFSAPVADNLPMTLGLLGAWHRNLAGAGSYAVVPYANRLGLLPAWLQQLDMESNGKRVALDGAPLAHDSGPLVWGGVGTDGQHAYFQWLHQGTSPTPVEFIGVRDPQHPYDEHHRQLLANLLGQASALAFGRGEAQTFEELIQAGRSEEDARRLAPHMTFPGNRPSTIIMLDRLDARSLGALLALYEHRVYVQSVLWNSNAFDQWGVELGKTLALAVEERLSADAAAVAGTTPDPSLEPWIDWLNR
ncbi:MAG: glucose-6-phosphate isomerase [Pseudomonadota bacterium]